MLILYIFACLLAAATTLVFTVLKLYEAVQWSWLLVLSPIWILWILFFGVIAAAYAVVTIREKRKKPAEAGKWSGIKKRCDFFRGLTR
jgi:heme/copper-type cytochrome/quinol oxidase subunit 2